jgi:hypothetical protein
MPRLRQHLISMVATFALLAGGGMALAGVGSVGALETTPACPTEQPSTSPSDAPTETDVAGVDEQGGDPLDVPQDAEPTDDGQVDDETGCDDPADDDEVDADDPQEQDPADDDDPSAPADEVPDPAREGECNDAAGVDPSRDKRDGATGLDNAIARVLANCIENASSPGLPNALRHLVANRERKAERDAAKAAGVHGNSANAPGHSGEHGGSSGTSHGNSANAPGHSGEHGNPHH